VLLDTFVVRPILVPAYLVILHSGRLGPLGQLLGGPAAPIRPAAAWPASAAASRRWTGRSP